jgi:hypothetical protein
MAGKPQNRLELRRQYEAAEPLDPMEDETEEVVDEGDEESGRRPRRKPKAPKAAKAPKAVKAPKAAARMRIVWAVVNDAFKTVGTFPYTEKAAAETRAAELTAKGKGTHFLQKTKEPMPDNAPGLGAVIPRPTPDQLAAIKPILDADLDEEEEDEEEEDEEELEDEDED